MESKKDVNVSASAGTSLTKEQRAKLRRKKRFKRKVRRVIRVLTSPTVLIGLALVILLTAAITIYVVTERNNGENAEYEKEYGRLTYQKQQLLSELESLGPDMDKQLGNTSYMSIIFSGLDIELYELAFPVMVNGENDISGVLAFSPNELPGLDGKITMEQYKRLTELYDWGTAIYWDGVGDLSEYITDMMHRLEVLEIPAPKSVYFKNGTYSVAHDDILEDHDIENAIHSGEDGLSHRVNGKPEGIWHPGCVGWQAGMSATLLKRQVEAEGGYALLAISFDTTEEHYSFDDIVGENDGKRLESFSTMINLFKMSVRNGDVEVFDVETTREKVTKYYSDRTTIELEHTQRRKEINAELAEIDRLLNELYSKYK